ncbi:MAG: hypothetical protein ACLTTQ_08330 [Christensenellales bacterium]
MENGIKSSGRQIPTFTVILAVLLSAGTALIAHDVFDGWLWLSLSAGFGAVAAFISGIRVLALAPLLGSIASAVIYAPFVPAWSAAAALLALLICLSAEGRMTKNVSLIASAAALILLGLLQFAADAYIGGELSWTAIWNEIKAPFSVMRDSLLSSAEAMEKSGGQIYGVSVGELTAAFRQMKASMLRVLPSIVIVTALFIGWLAHGIFGGCIRCTPAARQARQGDHEPYGGGDIHPLLPRLGDIRRVVRQQPDSRFGGEYGCGARSRLFCGGVRNAALRRKAPYRRRGDVCHHRYDMYRSADIERWHCRDTVRAYRRDTHLSCGCGCSPQGRMTA